MTFEPLLPGLAMYIYIIHMNASKIILIISSCQLMSRSPNEVYEILSLIR